MADQIDKANVYSQLQRSRGHQSLNLAVFQPGLCIQTQLARQAAVMCGYGLLAQTLRQIEGDTLSQAARVDEDQGRAVLPHQFGDTVIDFVPQFVAGNGTKFLSGDFNREVERAFVPHVDHHRIRTAIAGKKMCDGLNWFLRSRETDADWTLSGLVVRIRIRLCAM